MKNLRINIRRLIFKIILHGSIGIGILSTSLFFINQSRKNWEKEINIYYTKVDSLYNKVDTLYNKIKIISNKIDIISNKIDNLHKIENDENLYKINNQLSDLNTNLKNLTNNLNSMDHFPIKPLIKFKPNKNE